MSLDAIDGGGGIPPEPAWSLILDDDLEQSAAHLYWLGIVTEMREAETITVVNAHAIQRLVMAYINYDRASRVVASEGAVISKGRKSPRKSPDWMVSRQAEEMCRLLEGELGLTPRRRGSVKKVKRPHRKPSAADAYLKPVPPSNDKR